MKQMLLYLLMAPLVPLSHELAVHAGSAWWTHLVYMYGHAGWAHYLLNGLGWVMMRKIATPARTATAVAVAALLPATHLPVLGWSVVIYYYLGLCLASMPSVARMRLLALVGIGFFLPWIAAWHHAGMLTAGWILRKVERKWEKTAY